MRWVGEKAMQDAPTRLYYAISEVSKATKVKAHVLRYWETQFSLLRPRKSRGGIRKYRPKDVSLIQEIKHLLYDRGFTIAGASRKLREDRRAGRVDATEMDLEDSDSREVVADSPIAALEQLERASVVQETPPVDEVVARDDDQLPRTRSRQRPSKKPRAGAGKSKPWGLAEIRKELERLHAILQRSPDTLARVARTEVRKTGEMVQGNLGENSGIVRESPRRTGRAGTSHRSPGPGSRTDHETP